ncbi:MAG: DUF2191 domain-containing protein [Actinobacteria bacterium]|nr:DUF2191 domain-containing protein [Actinomycetota bacterium]MBA3629364.1 DUF2191 domain-containing protein [Actinomycetota bacterium]MDQ3531924.1 DUF2191 domain-containing protein [Actinomycetota bacterium]
MAKRTTLTLEDDVMSLVRGEARRTGQSVKSVVNDALRVGLNHGSSQTPRTFTVAAKDLGLRPGIDLDDIAGLIENLEGPQHR